MSGYSRTNPGWETADFISAVSIFSFVFFLTLLYLVRVRLKGRKQSQRVEKDQGSALLGKPAMEMAHWLFTPVAVFLSALKITPNGASYISLGLAMVAVVPLSAGLFGIASCLAFVSFIFDLVDGAMARHQKKESDAGEVLDAAVDRYGEFLFLAGLALFWHENILLVGVLLLTTLGTFMVSYSTAKAEALRVDPPRGAMRRPERAFYLTLGAAASPVWIHFFHRWQPFPGGEYAAVPMLAAVFLVGSISNISAVNRLRAIAAQIRRREEL